MCQGKFGHVSKKIDVQILSFKKTTLARLTHFRGALDDQTT